MVNPDDGHTVNGRLIRGWVLELVAAGKALRKSVELFKPRTIPAGQVARPLVYGDELPPLQNPPPTPPVVLPKVETPAPPMPPVAAPNSGHALNPKLAELRRTCNINLSMNNKVIPIDYVLKCLEP